MTEPCNIAAALPRLARERPGQVAMRCPGRDGGYDQQLTYAALDARSDAIAAGLRRRGVEIGSASCRERVCQYVDRSVGAVSLKPKQKPYKQYETRTKTK